MWGMVLPELYKSKGGFWLFDWKKSKSLLTHMKLFILEIDGWYILFTCVLNTCSVVFLVYLQNGSSSSQNDWIRSLLWPSAVQTHIWWTFCKLLKSFQLEISALQKGFGSCLHHEFKCYQLLGIEFFMFVCLKCHIFLWESAVLMLWAYRLGIFYPWSLGLQAEC